MYIEFEQKQNVKFFSELAVGDCFKQENGIVTYMKIPTCFKGKDFIINCVNLLNGEVWGLKPRDKVVQYDIEGVAKEC